MHQTHFIFILFMYILLMTGCTSTKIIAKQELSRTNHTTDIGLANISVGVLNNKDIPDYLLNQFILDLNKTKIFKRVEIATLTDKWPDILISNFQDNSPAIGEGFQCFEPYLLVISIGIIPSTCKRNHTLSFNVSRPGKKVSFGVEEAYLEKNATGWISMLLTPSEEDKFNGSKVEYLKAVFEHYGPRIQNLFQYNVNDNKSKP